MFNVHLLPGGFGDAILIEYGKRVPRYILVDGGPYYNFGEVLKGMKRVAPGLKTLELLVVTHIDIDHIDGLLVWLNQETLPVRIKDVWFNGYAQMEEFVKEDQLGVLQGELFSQVLKNHRLPHNKAFGGKAVVGRDLANLPSIRLMTGMMITVLAPRPEGLTRMLSVWDKALEDIGDEAAVKARLESDHRYNQDLGDLLGDDTIPEMMEAISPHDTSPANQSSIAFMAEFEGKRLLMAGDSPTRDLLPALDTLKGNAPTLYLDAWKLAHHGSRKSNQPEIMANVHCPKVLVSSDGKRYKHPDKECIAKLLKYQQGPTTFYFNYRSESNGFWDDPALQSRFHFETRYPPDGETGITIAL
jgi:beta-lactamase superfamily II metal-dependent hydrolase